MSKLILIVKADTNDADYVENSNEISQETLELIRPVIEAIKTFKPYKGKHVTSGSIWTHSNNYPTGDVNRDDLGEKSAKDLYGHLEGFETFDDLIPYGEYGIHTIESVRLLTVEEEEQLL